jgi:hypothetical protein
MTLGLDAREAIQPGGLPGVVTLHNTARHVPLDRIEALVVQADDDSDVPGPPEDAPMPADQVPRARSRCVALGGLPDRAHSAQVAREPLSPRFGHVLTPV